jgi:chemosensory pili system protein ChpA (sensor histidine kinase/response regulator)
VLNELYRLTHNLRTVATAVGLNDATQVAQGAEDLAEAIVSGAMPFDSEALDLFRDALSQLTHAICDDAQPAKTDRAAASAAMEEVPEELVRGFLMEAEELLERAWTNLQVLESEPGSRECILEVRRAVHTLKGSAAMVGLRDISKLAHGMEDALDKVNEQGHAYTSELHDRFGRTLDLLAEYVSESGTLAGPVSRVEELLAYYQAMKESVESDEDLASNAIAAQPAGHETAAFAPAGGDSAAIIRLPLERLDRALRGIGELSVARAAWDSQIIAHKRQLDELALSIRRCQQIAHRIEADYAVFTPGAGSNFSASPQGSWTQNAAQAPNQGNSAHAEFDALEFDRYTDFHLLARDLSEAASDLVTIETQLSAIAADFENTRARYSKATADLQDQVLHMRMAPVGSIGARLERTVRTAARATGKYANFRLEGSATELDKAALEQLAGPIEHLLRNSLAHGIEDRATRLAMKKPDAGTIAVRATREGANAVLQIRDDGRGIDSARVRNTAVRQKLIGAEQAAELDGPALHELLFEPGFSTAETVTEIAGRGVGLDVVRSAVESLKGSVTVESTPGQGTVFTLRVPLSQSIVRVIFVEASDEVFALPLSSVLRARKNEAGGTGLRPVDLEESLHLRRTPGIRSSLVLDNGAEQVELLVSRIVEIREVLVDPPAGMLRKAPAISGTTTLADGTVVLVLQPQRLLRASRLEPEERQQGQHPSLPRSEHAPAPLEVMVVDDSVSVRRVVANTLRKQGWNVSTAKDGLEALEMLHTMHSPPDVILLDVEMPRMDGYDFSVALRSEPKYQNLPVVMLTSRGGDKHRKKAFDVGVNGFLVKPYSEDTLVQTVRSCVARRVI